MPRSSSNDDDWEQKKASMEELDRSMDRYDDMINSAMSPQDIQRHKDLDRKHCEFYFRTMKKTQGPQPAPQETKEYLDSVPTRLRAAGAVRRRVFLVENTEGDDFDPYWSMLQAAFADISTYSYAWIGFIMSDLQHIDNALIIVRVLLVYASNLLTNPKYQDARQALQVLQKCQQAIGRLKVTLKNNTGEERWDLAYQEYKQNLYTSLAFAALGHRDESMYCLHRAVDNEQNYRMLAGIERKDMYRDSDPQGTMAQLNDHISVLNVLSQDLCIPRRHLDLTYLLEESHDAVGPLDKADENTVWNCILSLNPQGKSLISDPVGFCQKCWATAPTTTKLMKCSRCHKVFYCGRNCQLNDWKVHKSDCNSTGCRA